MLSTVFASLGAKVAAAALVAVTGTGAAAATGSLPDAAQSAVANAVEKVGISIPNPDDEVATADSEEGETTDESEGKRVDSDVRDVVNDDSLTGREKGEKVSDTADQNRQDDGRKPETPANADQGTSSNPSGYGQDSQPSGADSGSDAGQDTGTEQAEQGQSNNPSGQGRP